MLLKIRLDGNWGLPSGSYVTVSSSLNRTTIDTGLSLGYSAGYTKVISGFCNLMQFNQVIISIIIISHGDAGGLSAR